MELSSPRLKALTVSTGLSFWFFIITSAFGVFSLEIFAVFVAIVFAATQVVAAKVARGLDALAIFNTKVFLGALFVLVFSLYGIFFRALRIDLLRLKPRSETYWLEMEQLDEPRTLKQY